jgi:hypothetical protein
MSLGKCYECGEPVSSSAKRCPHCGADRGSTGRLIYAIVAVMVLVLVGIAQGVGLAPAGAMLGAAVGVMVITLVLLYAGSR